MIEELIGKLKTEVGGKISSEAKIPAGSMDGVFSSIGSVVKGEALKEIMSGNFSGLMNLFSDKPNNADGNKIQSKMHSGIVEELTSKLGISAAQSKSITDIALPALINMISKKNSKGDSSILTDIFKGKDAGGLIDMAKSLFGRFMK